MGTTPGIPKDPENCDGGSPKLLTQFPEGQNLVHTKVGGKNRPFFILFPGP